MSERISGAELARRLYDGHVAAAVTVPHAAAHLGWGSDVLGFDDARSEDHGFGPRLLVFVDASDVPAVADAVEAALPDEVAGHRVRFGWDDVPVTHHVHVADLRLWLDRKLGIDADTGPTTRDWLLAPQQRLLEVTGGTVFHDDGRLERVRSALRWYPDDLWLWLMAAQWRRVAQEEAFAGRTAEAGDDLGSRVVTARLARDLIRLSFLQERRYAPYAKWLGSGFARLDAANDVGPALSAALAAASWPEREDGLVTALEAAARRHNALGVTEALDAEVNLYFTRPFRVIGGDRFATACLDRVTDPELRRLPLVGSVDQATDSTDVLSPLRRDALGGLYPGLA